MITNSFGLALRDLRLARNLSQQDFSSVISREHVSRLERGVSQPNLEIVEGLARILKVHPLTLLAYSYQKGAGGKSLLEQFVEADEALFELGLSSARFRSRD